MRTKRARICCSFVLIQGSYLIFGNIDIPSYLPNLTLEVEFFLLTKNYWEFHIFTQKSQVELENVNIWWPELTLALEKFRQQCNGENYIFYNKS